MNFVCVCQRSKPSHLDRFSHLHLDPSQWAGSTLDRGQRWNNLSCSECLSLLLWLCLIINFYPVVSISVLLSVDVMDIAVLRNELFCLHDDGHLSHLSLLSPERCTERLMKRENWTLAATVCCMFQHAVIASRVHKHTVFIFSLITGYWWNSVKSFLFPLQARKSLPTDRLEQLKVQLNPASQQQLIGQLEEVISKLEPLDSACSSRRSSISSHVSVQ